MELLILINLVNTYLKKEYSQNLLKLKVLLEMLQYLILLFLYLKNINYGMKNKNRFVVTSGTNQTGYLFKIMESQFIHLQLVNGLKNLLQNILFLVRKNKGRQDQPFYRRPGKRFAGYCA